MLTATITNQHENVLEGTNAVFTVMLSGGTGKENVIVDFTVSGMAKPETDEDDVDGDYVVPENQTGVTGPGDAEQVDCDSGSGTCSGQLTIAAGATTGMLTINAIRDLDDVTNVDLLEGGETLTVTLTDINTAAGTVKLGTPIEATSTIIDHGMATVSLAPDSNQEGEAVELVVTLSGQVAEDVTVGYATSDRSATGADYVPAESGATLVIPAGETSGTITVDTLEDTLAEADESFTVTLSGSDLPANVVIGRPAARATITDDDDLTASVEVPQNVAEGSAAVFTVKLTGGTSTVDVVVDYTMTGGADVAVDQDYELPVGTTTTATGFTGKLTIPADVAMGTIVIPTIADEDADTAAQTLQVRLDAANTKLGPVTLASDPSAQTIIGGQDTVTVSVADTSVSERKSAVFTVQLSKRFHSEVTVPYGTVLIQGQAAEDDFTVESSGTLTIAAGSTVGKITVDTTHDTTAEQDETFTVELSDTGLTTGVVLGRATATGTIRDDDRLTVTIQRVGQTEPEEGGQAEFTVKLTGGTGGAEIRVDYAVGSATDTAKKAEDFEVPTTQGITETRTGFTGTLTIAAGDSTGAIIVETVSDTADALLEVGETLTVTLFDVDTDAGNVRLGTPNQATTTIGQSDRTVTVSVADAAPVEEEGNPAVFVVSMTGRVSTDVAVGYATANDSASAGTDYTAARGTVIIPTGMTAGTIRVQTANDNLEEPEERFTVSISLSGQAADVRLGEPQATATISANDALTASLTGPGHVAEGDTATYTVGLSGTVGNEVGSEDVVVAYTVTTDATAGVDYTEPSGLLTIRRSTKTGTFSIRTLKDDDPDDTEGDEDLSVTLTRATTGARTVTHQTAAVPTTIKSAATAIVSVADATVAEGGAASFRVTVAGGTINEEITVTYTVAPGTAETSDYIVPAGTLRIPARSGVITVQTLEDTLAEADETFTVSLTAADPPTGSTASVERGRMTATGTITDDETLTVTLVGPVTVVEGEEAVFTVALAGGVGGAAVEVDYAVGAATDTAEKGKDYAVPDTAGVVETHTGFTGTLQIAASSTADTITVTTTRDGTPDDDVLEVGETVTVALTSVTTEGEARLGTPKEATTTIADRGDSQASQWDGPVTMSVTDPAAVSEGSPAVFLVNLSGTVSSDVTVGYATANGTATTTDYASARGTLTIGMGEQAGTIRVQTADDNLEEPTETFMLTISLSGQPANVTLGDPKATATISANDALTASLTGPGHVAEGDTATYTVGLSGTVGNEVGSEDVVVAYTVTTDATAGVDYTEPSGLLTIRRSTKTGTFSIRTLKDDDPDDTEGDEDLSVTLTRATTGARTVTHQTAAVPTTIKSAATAIVSVADATVAEGGAASFRVTVAGGTINEEITVTYTVAPGTAETSDYIVPAGTLRIPARSGVITVQTLEDTLAEADETFTVSLTAADPPTGSTASVERGRMTATGTITDDETLTVTVGGRVTVTEGTPVPFTVSVHGASATVPVVATFALEGTATAGVEADYTAPETNTVTITAPDTSATMAITTRMDNLLEGDETLIFRLTDVTTTAGKVRLGTAQATTTIGDSDDDVTVSFESTAVPVDEGAVAMFTVQLSEEVAADVTVGYETADGTATAGADYTAVESGATLVIPAGETSGMIAVPTAKDLLEEADETFTLTLSLSGQPDYVQPGRVTATATIADDETLVASVEGPLNVAEGDAARFTVRLSGGTGSDPVVIRYSVRDTDDTATADDYDAPSGRLTIPKFTAMGTIVIRTKADAADEARETLTVTLDSATTATRTVCVQELQENGTCSGDNSSATTGIMPHDTVTVSVADVTAVEGDPAVFTVTLSETLREAVTVGYTTDDATADANGITGDYTDPGSRATVAIAAGQTEATFTIETLEDTETEPSETFTVMLNEDERYPLPENVEFGRDKATATITDDTLTVGVVGPDAIVEGEAAEFTVTLAGGPGSESVVVDYTVDGSATEEDHSGQDGTLTIPAGETTATIAIQTNDDEVLEGDETLIVTLTDASPEESAAVGTPASAVTTIEDNEENVTVSVADPPTAAEGREVTFIVTLSGQVGQDVVVRYATAPDTATTADFTAVSGTLTIAAGETTGTITVETVADENAEDADEKFTLRLTGVNLPPGVELKTADATATATITDLVLTASVTGPNTVDEGDAAVFTVTLAGGTSKADVVVEYNTDASTASADDYTEPNGTLTIAKEQPSGTIKIETINDDVLDVSETLEVTLTAVNTTVGLAELGTPAWAKTMIIDGDPVTMSVEDVEVVEGASAVFEVELSGMVATDVTVNYETSEGGTATEAVDYEAVSGTATVAAGDTTTMFTVDTLQDEMPEVTETFIVTVSGVDLPDGLTPKSTRATASILDDDKVIVALEGPETVTEGDSATFTASVQAGSVPVPVEVEYTVTGNAATPDVDYTAPTAGSLTILTGTKSAEIVIETIDDDVLDRGESFVVTLTGAEVLDGQGVAEIDPAKSEVTTAIEDNEEAVVVNVLAAPVEEGDPAVFTVELSGKVAVDVTLSYVTADGTATAGTDYEAVASGTAVVRAEQTTATFMVNTMEDALAEVTETFAVTLTGVNLPDGVGPESTTATATIEDDDELTVILEGTEMVPEGEVASFTVTLSQPLPEPVTVSYATADGTATAGADYVAAGLAAAAEIAAGDIRATFIVATTEDTLAEADETFLVTLTAVNRPAVLETLKVAPLPTATVTIVDDDKLTMSVTGPETVVEGSVATYTVTLAGGTSSAAVVVDYNTAESTATKDKDYTEPSGKLTIALGSPSGRIAIQTTADKVVDPRETLVVKLTGGTMMTAPDEVKFGVGTPAKAATEIIDPVFESINRVNQALLPGVTRASAASTLDALSRRMELAAPANAPMPSADLAGLTNLYRALQANERALQDGSYDLAQVLGGSSFLVPLSSHDGMEDTEISFAIWGSGDYRSISGGDPDAADVDWNGSAWGARLGADMRFIDSLLAGLAVSWTGSALDYEDDVDGADMSGTYGSSLISVHPYVGWTTPDYGLWAAFGLGWGEVQIDDSVADAQSTAMSQWSLGGGASVTLLATDAMIAGGITALKLKAEGSLAHAEVEKSNTIDALGVDVNQVRAILEASHAQHFPAGGSLTPSLEVGGRLDGGDGETGAGLEVGGGLSYADSGLAVEARGRALVLHGGNYGEWGLTGLFQYDPGTAGHGLMVSVRPTWGATASGVAGLWEHGTLDLLGGNDQAGGRVEAEIGYGLAVFGASGVLTPYAGALLTDAGANSLSVGGRLQIAPAFEVSIEALRSESADVEAAPDYGLTLEGAIRW